MTIKLGMRKTNVKNWVKDYKNQGGIGTHCFQVNFFFPLKETLEISDDDLQG